MRLVDSRKLSHSFFLNSRDTVFSVKITSRNMPHPNKNTLAGGGRGGGESVWGVDKRVEEKSMWKRLEVKIIEEEWIPPTNCGRSMRLAWVNSNG